MTTATHPTTLATGTPTSPTYFPKPSVLLRRAAQRGVAQSFRTTTLPGGQRCALAAIYCEVFYPDAEPPTLFVGDVSAFFNTLTGYRAEREVLLSDHVIDANDTHHKSFEEIAEWLEHRGL